MRILHLKHVQLEGKSISVTRRAGSYGCETSRLPHFLQNRLTIGGEVVILMRLPSFTLKKIPDTHFCSEADSSQGLKSPITSSGIEPATIRLVA
jgi:hypothetical protein